MKLTPEQWIAVRDEYVKDAEATYRSLSKKYKTSVTTINEHAKKENWPQLRKEYESERAEHARNQPVTDSAADLKFLVDSLATKIKASLAVVPPNNTQSIRHLTASIKDLAELQQIIANRGGNGGDNEDSGVILLPQIKELDPPEGEEGNDE